MAWTLCSSEAAIARAGANANSTIVASEARLAEWSDQIEGLICAETRRDWITSAASNNTSGALWTAAASLIANEIINYDMSGYTSRLEAQTMLDVNENAARKILATLEKKEVQEKM